MPSSVICKKLFLQFFLYSAVQKSIKRNKWKLSTLSTKSNIVVEMQLTVHRETIKTTAAMGCEWLELMNRGWITK